MSGQTTRKLLPNWAVNLGLALAGTGVALLLLQGLISLFPGLLPGFLRSDPFDLRQPHPEEIEVTYTVGNGDLFILQAGSIAPPPNPDEVLTQFTLSYDEDGFRRPLIEGRRYPIIALGDSFTDGGQTPKPWPDVLAEELGKPVRNLGFRGYGPREYAKVMNLYGTEERHDWVVIGFFEGNDLSRRIVDIADEPFELPRIARQAFETARGDYTEPDYGEGPWKYPVEMQLGDQTHPVAFAEFFLWQLNGLPEDYENSLEMATLGEQLASIREDAGDACVLLAYFPIKSHIYFPYVTDPDDQNAVLQSAERVDLDENGRLTRYPMLTTYDELVSRMNGQSIAVGNLARQQGLHFVDVTAPLEEAAARGEEAYYPYDTHWNQVGHDIAGQAIADYIRDHPECGL